MKRINNLYNKIISIENLNLADKKARKGKLHSYGVIHHDLNRESNIIALHELLKNDISDKDYKQNICSWLGWTKYSNSRHLLKTIIKPKYYGSIL